MWSGMRDIERTEVEIVNAAFVKIHVWQMSNLMTLSFDIENFLDYARTIASAAAVAITKGTENGERMASISDEPIHATEQITSLEQAGSPINIPAGAARDLLVALQRIRLAPLSHGDAAMDEMLRIANDAIAKAQAQET